MKKICLLFLASFMIQNVMGQNPGDTIIVQTFDYSMTYGQAWGPPRDTVAHFPNDPSITYEKIIMAYSMRCKDAQVNTTGGNNVACGEWDYSCHSYIHDSTRTDSILNWTNSHSITGFSGTTYNYTATPTYNYYYNIDTITGTVIVDSLENIDTVYAFNIISNYGTLMDDFIDTISTDFFWSPYSYTYDTNGAVISIDTSSISGTININTLPYYKRYPMAFQIMSFVTPYGIGLDLGVDGKTWYFDMTDYAPIFKGPKRITVSGGGQWQEDMDIKFYFIVGTPPRDVLNLQQIWRPQSKGYNAIMNDDAFEPRDVLMHPNAASYKLKTVITGHGQEGEFVSQNHYLNIDGGAQEYVWPVWTECAENPIYPQGGTWIYDRAGWCPGQASDVREDDITSLVTPGQIHNIDYGVVSAFGTSNYWVSSQLVSYADANHSLDAAVIDILSPTNNILYLRKNPICSKPKITIQNRGNTPLTSLDIEYWINNATNKELYQWTGNLNFMETEEIELPDNSSLWANIDYSGGVTVGEITTYESNPELNKIYIEVKNPNGGNDEYSHNNQLSSSFTPAPIYPNIFTFWYQTNGGIIGGVSETSWDIKDSQGSIMYSGYNLSPNSQYKDTISLNDGCYALHVSDTDDDGLDFWANSDGAGMLRFRRLEPYIDTSNIPWVYYNWFKTFNLDFGSFIHHEFITGSAVVNIVEESKSYFNIFPNPTSNEIFIKGLNKNNGALLLFDKIGRIVYEQKVNAGIFNINIDMSSYADGIYLLKLISKNSAYVRKVVKK